MNNLIKIIKEEIFKLNETVGELDKYYVRTNIFDNDDRNIILSITGGDAFTKLISDCYYYLGNRYKSTYDTIIPRKLNQKEIDLLKQMHTNLINYNKNTIPIHDLYAKEHNAHPLEKMNDLNTRNVIISRLKSLPSIAIRNLKNDIRIERDHYQLDKLNSTLVSIQNYIKLLDRLKPENMEKVNNKIFSSNITTFDELFRRLENVNIPYLSQEQPMESIIEMVDDMGSNAEIIYNVNNVLVVKIMSSKAMQYLGCSSQWCFATETGDEWWNQYSSNGFAFIVYNFNVEEGEKDRMLVVLSTGEVYDMYNEYLEDGSYYLSDLGVSDAIYNNMQEPVEVD